MEYFSLWEDAIYVAEGVEKLPYYIYDEGVNLLYAGVAVARPDSINCEINVSRIIQNYMNSDLPASAYSGTSFVLGQYEEPNAIREFSLTDTGGTILEQYTFLNCWNYETQFSTFAENNDIVQLSNPINGHKTMDMLNFSSIRPKGNQVVRTTISTGITTDHCGLGAIYYTNSLGGWDSFLVECPIKTDRKSEAYNIDNPFRTGTLDFGHRTLNYKLSDSYTINTNYMTDTESKKLCYELFGSNKMYLHVFDSNKIIPVVMETNSITVKTRKTNGKKMFFHQFKLTASQDRMRW